jgi:hypothetical protein
LTKATRSKPNKPMIPEGMTMQDWAAAIFKTLSIPGVARELKGLADDQGVELEVVMHVILAHGYHTHGQPLPPDLREYLLAHEMPPWLRDKALKPLLN